MKREVQQALSSSEEAIKALCTNYIDNIVAYIQDEKVTNVTGKEETANETLMRDIEEKIGISTGMKDDFRREIMNYMGGLAFKGKFKYDSNRQLYKALEKKLFEDTKDSIKLSALAQDTGVVDKELLEKIDALKQRLITSFGYDEDSASDVLTYVGSIFARGDADDDERVISTDLVMPSRRIEDHGEYRDIVKGNVDDKLKKHIKSGQRISRRGKDFVVVRVPHVELPSFRYGQPADGSGIGNGEAGVGDEVGEGPQQQGNGQGGQPGDGGEGEGDGHEIDVGISMDAYFDMIGEELQLPNLQPKDNGEMVKEKIKWNRIAKVGNNSLLHKRKTLKNAFKRLISSGDYNEEDLSNFIQLKKIKNFVVGVLLKC